MRFSCSIEETQKELLSLLVAFDDVCRKEKVYYSLHAGTLLGAVREKGFIPWDNDADILMTRNQYEKLMQVISKYPNYDIREYDLLPKFIREDPDSDVPFGWIDIFICDKISENAFAKKIKIIITLMMRFFYRDNEMRKLAEGNGHSKIQMIATRVLCGFGKLFPQEKKREWIQRFFQYRLTGDGNYIYRANDYLRGMKLVEPKEYLDSFCDTDFAGERLQISKYAEKILTDSYGSDYMTPRYEQAAEDRHEGEKTQKLFQALYRQDKR